MSNCPFCGSSKIKEPGLFTVDWGTIALTGVIGGGFDALKATSDAIRKESKKDWCRCKRCHRSWFASDIILYEKILQERFNFRLKRRFNFIYEEDRELFELLDNRRRIHIEIEFLKRSGTIRRREGASIGFGVGGGLGIFSMFIAKSFSDFLLILFLLPICLSAIGFIIGFLVDLVCSEYQKLGAKLKKETEKAKAIENKIEKKLQNFS